MPTLKKTKRSGQTAERVFQRLIEAILNEEFTYGQRIPEARLARQWKVSRTPLREAMRRAAESGFVVLRPNYVPLVRRLTSEEIRDLYELRRVLEAHALKESWERITPAKIKSVVVMATAARPNNNHDWVRHCLDLDRALHGLWINQCGNSWLIKDLQHHYHFLHVFQRWIARNPDLLAESYHQHVEILKAVESGDKTKALAVLNEHISASENMVERILRGRKLED